MELAEAPGGGRKVLRGRLAADARAPWVAAYRGLDTSPIKIERVEGVPMKFIPANTRSKG